MLVPVLVVIPVTNSLVLKYFLLKTVNFFIFIIIIIISKNWVRSDRARVNVRLSDCCSHSENLVWQQLIEQFWGIECQTLSLSCPDCCLTTATSPRVVKKQVAIQRSISLDAIDLAGGCSVM